MAHERQAIFPRPNPRRGRAGHTSCRVPDDVCLLEKKGISHNGVCVVIRHENKVLAVRHSYRPEYTIPGGGIGKNETPAIASARELNEELSLQVAPEGLVYLRQMRNTHLMELRLVDLPDIRIDNREIIEAIFLSEDEVIRRNPQFRRFLEAS